MPQHPQAFFLPVDDGRTGQRLCLFHPARGGVVHGSVLYVHPFAEEMNKSRRVAAQQARALAQAGYSVLQIDLMGCGDSSGDFGDAAWQDWVGDVVRGCGWLRERSDAPLWLWGLRTGCLLAREAALQMAFSCNFVFWAPIASGKLQLQQFLRLKAAADLLGGNAKGVTDGLRQQLSAGHSVEVAGYRLSPALANGLEQATLVPPSGSSAEKPPRMEWLELSMREDAALSPASAKSLAQWSQAGFSVGSQVVAGPSFWQTSEIEEAPDLITATVAAITGLPQRAAL